MSSNELLSDRPRSDQPQWPRIKGLGKAATAAEKAVAWDVFGKWVQITGRDRRPGRAPKLTGERARKIIERNRDGFSVDDMEVAIRHWNADPHHRGQNDRNTVYDDLETYLMTETKVQKAIEAATGKTVVVAADLEAMRRESLSRMQP